MSSRIPDPKIEQRNVYVKGKSSPSASRPRKLLSVTELSAITGLALVSALTHAGVMSKPRPKAGHGKGGCKDQGGDPRAEGGELGGRDRLCRCFAMRSNDERGANDVGGIRCCCFC